MDIVIAGGHGQIALHLSRLLADRGDSVTGIIRNPDQAADLREVGAEPAVLDLEGASTRDVAAVLAGADAVVFAAGAGPGSGIERKYTVDEGAADLCVDAALAAGVPRFLQVSAMGTDNPPTDDSVFSHYLRAKAAAEGYLRRSALPHVIVRPGRLTNDPPTGLVQLGRHVPWGSVPRADVAAALVALLDWGTAPEDCTVALVSGSTAITDAVAGLD